MSILNSFKSFFVTVETDVQKVIVAIKTGEQVVAKDLQNAINWIASNAGTITTGVNEAETMLQQILAATPGAAQNATVTKIIADANIAVTQLNAFATAANAGSTAQAVVAGYAAVQNGLAAAATAKAAVANLATTTNS